ncbi:hypothetical protein V8F20_001474 [Naviculisporaceae sp. PSN 640]
MKSQVYLQLLAPQLFIGASSAWLFAWSRSEGSPVLPRQTDTVKHVQARLPAPEPTSPPVPFKAPRKDARLLKRDVSTCGYRDGNENLPLECGAGYYCFHNHASSLMDCCSSADVQDCTPAVTCLDRTQSKLWNGGRDTWLCDDPTYPSCVTLRYGPGSYSGYTWIACGRTADDSGTAYWEPLSFDTFTSEEPIIPPPPRTITVTQPDDPDITTPVTPPTPPPADPAAASSNNSSSVPIGPIVGGAVGGVAVIALIGFGIFFLVFKKKRQDNVQPQNIQPQPVVSQVPSPGPGGPFSPTPPVGGATATNTQDLKGYYHPSNVPVAGYINGASPPTSPVPPYTSTPSPNPMQGAVSPMSMSAVTNSQYGPPTGAGGSPQPGLGVMQQQQQPGQFYTQQTQPPQQQQGYFYPHGQAAELDTARGDGEVRELP